MPIYKYAYHCSKPEDDILLTDKNAADWSLCDIKLPKLKVVSDWDLEKILPNKPYYSHCFIGHNQIYRPY